MEIIKRGKLKPIVVEQGTEISCSACESLLKYFPNDLKCHVNEDGSIYYVNCPVCANVVLILTIYPD
jgi:hypothetical protein